MYGVGGRVQLRSIQYGRCPEAVAGGERAHAGYYEDAERADGGGHQMVKDGGEATGKEENIFTNLLCNIGLSLIFVIIHIACLLFFLRTQWFTRAQIFLRCVCSLIFKTHITCFSNYIFIPIHRSDVLCKKMTTT